MSQARVLCETTLQTLVSRFHLQEIGHPFMALKTPEGGPFPSMPVGSCRIFTGGPVQKLVYIGLTVDAIGMDSHMLFAFAAPENPLPHFTLDSVKVGPTFAFHLDLIPRVELGVELAYMDATYGKLTPLFQAGRQLEGLSPAQLSPRQLALMSPWMLAHRATEGAFERISETVAAYLEHWIGLTDQNLGLPLEDRWSDKRLAEHDQRHRNVLFDPAVDPVWANVDRLIGPKVSQILRETLKRQEVEQAPNL